MIVMGTHIAFVKESFVSEIHLSSVEGEVSEQGNRGVLVDTVI